MIASLLLYIHNMYMLLKNTLPSCTFCVHSSRFHTITRSREAEQTRSGLVLLPNDTAEIE